MHVATVTILTNVSFGYGGGSHRLAFDSLEAATAEYDRIAALMLAYKRRANDLPHNVEVVGTHTRITIHLDEIHSIAIDDLKGANEQAEGVREAFPNLAHPPKDAPAQDA